MCVKEKEDPYGMKLEFRAEEDDVRDEVQVPKVRCQASFSL